LKLKLKYRLAHALVVAIAKFTNDPDYNAFIQGRKIHSVEDRLLATTGNDLTNGRGIPELIKFKEHFKRVQNCRFRRIKLL
jgi:hypothetical protein